MDFGEKEILKEKSSIVAVDKVCFGLLGFFEIVLCCYNFLIFLLEMISTEREIKNYLKIGSREVANLF